MFFLKKLIPSKVFNLVQPVYHYLLALAGAVIYRFPSRQLKVIGITGTKGKTSTVEILSAILEAAGFKTATTSTLQFKIAGQTERNLYKMSMPGRFFLQKFLRRAITAGCDFAIIEMTSEGAKLFRHKFINPDGLIFTNLSPEHIESHGSYEKYLAAKLEYARALTVSPKKNKIMVVNGEDGAAEKFLAQAGNIRKIKFTTHDAEPYRLTDNYSHLTINGEKIITPLIGKFNIYNILAAIKMAEAQGVKTDTIKQALENFSPIAGRMEKIVSGNPKQNFDIIIDYAHTADSLTKAYEALGTRRKICVLGSTGGGRDKWKRPQMGKVASDFCSEIILTNEDPYDEDPRQIMEEVASGMKKNYQIIMDRREAIRMAIKKAEVGDVVIITGKGTDPYIMGPNGQKTPWSDYVVAKEELEKILN